MHDAQVFVAECAAQRPRARMSLGWTTGQPWFPWQAGYTAAHIDAMLAVCDEFGLQDVTFAVSALHAQQVVD